MVAGECSLAQNEYEPQHPRAGIGDGRRGMLPRLKNEYEPQHPRAGIGDGRRGMLPRLKNEYEER